MEDILIRVVSTKRGRVRVRLDKQAMFLLVEASGIDCMPATEEDNRAFVPEVSPTEFRELVVKFLMNFYPSLSSAPPRFSYSQAQAIAAEKVRYLEAFAQKYFVNNAVGTASTVEA